MIAGQIAWNLERRVLQDERLLPGRDVKIIDGTGVSLPDTSENQAVWPQPKGQKPGCGFPVLKMAGLFSLASGALLAHVTGRQTAHDSRLFHELWPQLKKGDVILGDRAFCSYPAMVALQQRGIDTLVRLHQFRPADMRRGRRLGQGDQLVVWTKAKLALEHLLPDEFASLPEQLPVRLIRTLIAYNLVRSLMQQAAQLHDLPLERISFKGSLDALRHSAQAIHASARQPREQAELINRLLESIACDPIPHRSGRAEPRARKRRPKNYQLLTHPRRQMKVTNHRNKHRAIHPNSSLS